jgi:hypothetical protein
MRMDRKLGYSHLMVVQLIKKKEEKTQNRRAPKSQLRCPLSGSELISQRVQLMTSVRGQKLSQQDVDSEIFRDVTFCEYPSISCRVWPDE